MSINRAAMEHVVPPTTLKDRLSGRVKHGTKLGPKPYLSLEEEEELAHFLANCSKMGYGKVALARLLTSVENLAILEEKEKKKLAEEKNGTKKKKSERRRKKKKEGRGEQEKGRRESPKSS